MNRWLLHRKRRLAPLAATPTPPTPTPGLLGVGSVSTSHVDYPPMSAITSGNYYVSTTGSDSNAGTSIGSAFKTIQKAIDTASSGHTILVLDGTYPISQALSITKSLTLSAYGSDRPVLDRGLGGTTSGEGAYGVRVTGSNVVVRRFELRGVPERTDALDASFAVYVTGSNVRVEDVLVHSGRTGCIRFSNGNDGLVLDCVIFNNKQVLLPSNPSNVWDGVAGTHSSYNSSSINNFRVVRTLVANAADDGFDLWAARNSRFVDCVSVGAGYYPEGGAGPGDGGGFKMGGSGGGAGSNLLLGCIAVGSKAIGLNGNTTKSGGNTYSYNTTTTNWRGIINDSDASPVYTNHNIDVNNSTASNIYSSGQSNNSFNLSITNPRFADPSTGDFSLASNSPAIGAGTSGTNLGASSTALALLKKWWNHSKIFIPGRGTGPGGTGLPADTGAPPSPTPGITLPPTPSTFYWQLQGSVLTNRSEQVYDIDGFDNSKATFDTLKSNDKYLIAYFSAGTWEDWREDASSFPARTKGNSMDDWAGEKWLNWNYIDDLRPIMEGRADIAKAKGAHAIEWDNLDGYDQGSSALGFTLSEAAAKNFLQMLADITHERGMAAIFKNTPDLSSWAVNRFDGVVVEEAYRYNEIGSYTAWMNAGKPVWAIEYTGTLDCVDAQARGIFLAKYPLNLNGPPTGVCNL